MTDEQQFEAFMLVYQDMVFTTAVRLLAREAEAEDVSQEVFLKAFEHYDEIRNSPTIGGWLKTVTRNLCLNHLTRYRARWRYFTELTDEDSDVGFLDKVAAPDRREEDVTVAGQRQVLEAALQKLSPKQRVPLVLYHFEDLSYEEIAARLKISLAKVKTDIHRGREALRQKLQLASVGAAELEGWTPSGPAAAYNTATPTPISTP